MNNLQNIIRAGVIALVCAFLSSSAFSLCHPCTVAAGSGLQFNVVNDFGATCNGVADDAPAFTAAAHAFRANSAIQAGTPVTLTVPAGAHCVFNTNCGDGQSFYIFEGIPVFTENATGATMTINAGGSDCQAFGAHAIIGGAYDLIQTVSAGASCVTMVTSGQTSDFPIGSWALVNGIGMQFGGYPPNLGIFEYQQVVSSGSGQVCFTKPLANSYKSTWPDFDVTHTACSGACGGPAAMFSLRPHWVANLTINGGTWNLAVGSEFIFGALEITLNNMTIHNADGSECAAPTEGKSITFNNLQMNCVMEVDKDIDTLTFNGGSPAPFVASSSTNNYVFNNVTNVGVAGTPQNTVCNNSTLSSLALGPSEFLGTSKSFSGTNCVVSSLIISTWTSSNLRFNQPGWSMSGGVITQSVANVIADSYANWMIPGRHYAFTGGNQYSNFAFQITDMAISGSNLNVTTSLSGGFPAVPADTNVPSTSTDNGIALQDPAYSWSCSNCSGNPTMVDLSQPGAQNAPIFTYSNRTYTCKANVPNIPNSIDINGGVPSGQVSPATVWGNLVSLTVNVSTADTSAGTPMAWRVDGIFNNWRQMTGSGVELFFAPLSFDLKTAGTRVWTPSGITGEVGADSLIAAQSIIMTGSSVGPFLSNDLTNEPAGQCPVVTLTWQTSR